MKLWSFLRDVVAETLPDREEVVLSFIPEFWLVESEVVKSSNLLRKVLLVVDGAIMVDEMDFDTLLSLWCLLPSLICNSMKQEPLIWGTLVKSLIIKLNENLGLDDDECIWISEYLSVNGVYNIWTT